MFGIQAFNLPGPRVSGGDDGQSVHAAVCVSDVGAAAMFEDPDPVVQLMMPQCVHNSHVCAACMRRIRIRALLSVLVFEAWTGPYAREVVHRRWSCTCDR